MNTFQILVFTFLIIALSASSDSTDDIRNQQAPTSHVYNRVGSQLTGVNSPLVSNYKFATSFWLSMAVLAFGCLTMVIELTLIRKGNFRSEDIIRFITITLIVTGALFLISAGYTNDQIAPAFGLLGTIAGYLLGRSTRNGSNSNKNNQNANSNI